MGLVLLSLNIEPLLERLLVNSLFFWEKIPIRTMVIKNLVAHRKRNTKTTIMYALSLGFIIFVMVSYNNILDGFAYQREQRSGVYLKVMARGQNDDTKNPLEWRNHIIDTEGLENFLRNRSSIISDHAWVSQTFDDAWKNHNGPTLENIGRYIRSICLKRLLDESFKTTNSVPHRAFKDRNRLYSISPNFMDVVFDSFLILREGIAKFQYLSYRLVSYSRDSGSEYNNLDMSLSEQLYTIDGSSRAWMGTLYQTLIGQHVSI